MVETRAKRANELGKNTGGKDSKQGATNVGMHRSEGDLLPSGTGDKRLGNNFTTLNTAKQ